MTDFTHDIPDTKRHRRMTREYRVYFVSIFLVAVPFCTASWAYRLIRLGKLPHQGPIQSAINEARTITPHIF